MRQGTYLPLSKSANKLGIHIADEETEAQKGSVSRPKSAVVAGGGPGFEPEGGLLAFG